MHPQYIHLADLINRFKFERPAKDISPPNLTQEQVTVRNLVIIDLTNELAEALAKTTNKFNKEEWLSRALTRRK